MCATSVEGEDCEKQVPPCPSGQLLLTNQLSPGENVGTARSRFSGELSKCHSHDGITLCNTLSQGLKRKSVVGLEASHCAANCLGGRKGGTGQGTTGGL